MKNVLTLFLFSFLSFNAFATFDEDHFNKTAQKINSTQNLFELKKIFDEILPAFTNYGNGLIHDASKAKFDEMILTIQQVAIDRLGKLTGLEQKGNKYRIRKSFFDELIHFYAEAQATLQSTNTENAEFGSICGAANAKVLNGFNYFTSLKTLYEKDTTHFKSTPAGLVASYMPFGSIVGLYQIVKNNQMIALDIYPDGMNQNLINNLLSSINKWNELLLTQPKNSTPFVVYTDVKLTILKANHSEYMPSDSLKLFMEKFKSYMNLPSNDLLKELRNLLEPKLIEAPLEIGFNKEKIIPNQVSVSEAENFKEYPSDRAKKRAGKKIRQNDEKTRSTENNLVVNSEEMSVKLNQGGFEVISIDSSNTISNKAIEKETADHKKLSETDSFSLLKWFGL